MALVLTVVSIVLWYFSPGDLFPEISKFHIQRFLLAPAIVSAVSLMHTRRVWHIPQYILMLGFWFAIVMSKFSKFRLGAGWTAFATFAVVACLYYLVAINSYTVRRITIFSRVVVICALVMALQSITAFYTGFRANDLVLTQRVGPEQVVVDRRITGQGVLDDPNDFGQFLVVALALLGVSWSRYNPLKNVLTVFIPAAILLFAVFLTGSRGTMFGVVAIGFVMVSRRAGVLKSLIISGALFALMLLANFGGGRTITLHEASATGRIVAWGSGLGQLRRDPLFGVGFDEFTKYNSLTAHNSFVLCFAELGFFGYFFWIAMIITSAMGLEYLAKLPRKTPEELEFGRMVSVIRAALYAYLSTSWFLSRTYDGTLYVLLALAGGLIYVHRREFAMETTPMLRWVPVTFCAQAASIAMIYLTIRFRNL
jgi:putative inorganic carbon (HCO3(-)) transporter